VTRDVVDGTIMSNPRRLPAAGSFGCDRFDDRSGHDPAVTSLAPRASNGSSARQEHSFAVTCMKCYNITFFLRLPLLRAKEQVPPKAHTVLLRPGAPMKKAGVLFPLRRRKAIAKKSSHLKPWPVRPPVPAIWQNRFERIDGRYRRKQC